MTDFFHAFCRGLFKICFVFFEWGGEGIARLATTTVWSNNTIRGVLTEAGMQPHNLINIYFCADHLYLTSIHSPIIRVDCYKEKKSGPCEKQCEYSTLRLIGAGVTDERPLRWFSDVVKANSYSVTAKMQMAIITTYTVHFIKTKFCQWQSISKLHKFYVSQVSFS